MDSFIKQNVMHHEREHTKLESHHLVVEEPLSIRIQGKAYSITMRTPGDEMAHVAGFCFSEGIIDHPDDLSSIGLCDGVDSNVVAVTLQPERRKKIAEHLERRGFVSQTSCGICGKEQIRDISQKISPVTKNLKIDVQKALDCLDNLSTLQPLRKKTRATHSAALYGRNLEPLSDAEDVGRHNALDKAIGKLFLANKIKDAGLLVLSSRISYELVQKAARARIPIILAISRPTSLAVGLAENLNISLACLADESGLLLFSHAYRFNPHDLKQP